jgi:hypothetical protein
MKIGELLIFVTAGGKLVDVMGNLEPSRDQRGSDDQ